MAPNATKVHPLYAEIATEKPSNPQGAKEKQYKCEIVWGNVIFMGLAHIGALYGGFLLLFKSQWSTAVFSICFGIITMCLGTTAGGHRLWSHRSYQANLPLRILLMVFQTFALQNTIYRWARDHRAHHKFSDTDADPHNPKRGLFFAHIGWVLVRRHKDLLSKGKTIDLRDLDADAVVQFQKKYFPILKPMAFIIPILIPIYFFGEDPWISFFSAGLFRWVLFLHSIWLVNSAAHKYGTRPYDKTITPSDNLFVGYAAFGEGWHNYHHVFPWDYKAAELGNYGVNLTLLFIDFFAKIGWAYDLKTVSREMVEKRSLRSGDGSHAIIKKGLENNNVCGDHHHHEDMTWGWGDTDMKDEDVQDIKEYNKIS